MPSLATNRVQIQELQQFRRQMRHPEHRWHVRHKPYVVQPVMIAPVLPGESLKSMLFQSRCVTDPIKNPLIGWWLEYYWFYVKHRDLDGRDTFANMVLVQDTSLAAFDRAADQNTYHASSPTAGKKIDWTWECLRRVVDVYFRDKGDSYTNHQVAQPDAGGNMPMAKIVNNSWLDSVKDATLMDEGGSPQDGTETLMELDIMLRKWELMRDMGLMQMTYEDFLETYGIKPRREDLHEPELVRYVRAFQYPSNTINPADGTPTSAVSWSISEKISKARFFREPGFLFGVTVARPKVYLSKQAGAGVSMLRDALSWLPAMLWEQRGASLKEFLAAVGNYDGPLINNTTNGYWVDIKDLFIYGDQFVNFALSATDAGLVAVPTAALEKFYASSADINGLFTNGGTGKNLVKQDGVASLHIAGAMQDTT